MWGGLGSTTENYSDGRICVVQENVGDLGALLCAKGAITLDDLSFNELVERMVNEAIAIIHKREKLFEDEIILQQEEIRFNIFFSNMIKGLTMQPVHVPIPV